MSKAWLVTGCSRGLGRELAQAALAAGHRLIATARDPRVTRAALPVIHAQRDGHIIQISSIGGRRTTAGLGAYQSAKWAVGGFSEVLAREVAPLGIRVTCVEPGGMRTDMFGLSMLDETIASDYKPTVDAVLRGIFGNADRARNGRAKVAQVILRLADEQQPPVRLLVGSDDGLGDFAATDGAESVTRPRA